MAQKTRFKRPSRFLVAGLFLVATIITQFSMGGITFAAAKTWDGSAGDGLFSTGANWSGNTAPVDGDSIIFPVAGLVSDVTLNNDIVGLSLVGITFSGVMADGSYIINGNSFDIQGAIDDATTGTNDGYYPRFNNDMNMTGPLSIENAVISPTSTVTMNGFALSLGSDITSNCAPSTFGGDLVGNGALTISGGKSQFGGTNSAAAGAYTGAITVNSGARLILDVNRMDAASSVTVNNATLFVSLQYEVSIDVATPLTIGGSLQMSGGGIGWSGCAGDSSPDDNDLILSGPVTLTGPLDYEGFGFSGSLMDTTVTGLYDSNGYAVTNDPSSDGTMTVPADTAPNAPTGLSATPGDTQVALDWDAPAYDGGPSITDYRVQYKLSSSGTWLTFADGTSTTSAGTVTGLTNGSSYDFRVAATNSVGTGSNVTVSNITPSSGVVVATAPLNLVGTPASTQVGLDWDAPSSNGGGAIIDYIVQYKLSSSGTWLTFADGTSTTSNATVTGLTNSSNYDFRVAAVNSAGTGPYVTITGVAPSAGATAPNAPTGLALTIDDDTNDLVLDWTAPASDGGAAITDYLIEVKLSSGSTWTTVSHAPFTGTSFAIYTGLTDGQTYDVRVSAINAQGTGPTIVVANFLYNPGDGSSGNVGNAGGNGAGQTPGAPNTGLPIRISNPLTVFMLGLGTAVAFLIAFWPRKRNLGN